jgi:hypothetical protein
MGYLFVIAVVIGVAALARSHHNSRGRLPASSRGIVGQHELQFDACGAWIQHTTLTAPSRSRGGPIPARLAWAKLWRCSSRAKHRFADPGSRANIRPRMSRHPTGARHDPAPYRELVVGRLEPRHHHG